MKSRKFNPYIGVSFVHLIIVALLIGTMLVNPVSPMWRMVGGGMLLLSLVVWPVRYFLHMTQNRT